MYRDKIRKVHTTEIGATTKRIARQRNDNLGTQVLGRTVDQNRGFSGNRRYL